VRAQSEDCAPVRRTQLKRFHLRAETHFANGRRFPRVYADKVCPGSGRTKALVPGWLNGK
jgi:hypothetical protein